MVLINVIQFVLLSAIVSFLLLLRHRRIVSYFISFFDNKWPLQLQSMVFVSVWGLFLVVFFGKIKLLVIFTRFWYMCMWDLLGSYGFWTGILLTILLGAWGLFGEEIFVVLFCRLTVSDWYMYGYKSSLSSHMQLSNKKKLSIEL